jgi:2-succinyl-5-enolpyruvyl-6-hydroxy-3-cyclohexene-1-carboxylate synthase
MAGTPVQHAAFHFAGALVDELVRAGVHHFCACPGSRSTPLAVLIARHPGARLWMHLDERSAAFFGLGLAKALRQPVALLCTSGTAAANFMPAVIEAFYARVPLVVLTADRPHELRDCGAAQTIDQLRLYGGHVKWFVDLPEPDAAPELVRYARTVACRAVALARRGPAGPVHVNCPFREPLVPVSPDGAVPAEARSGGEPYVTVASGPRAPEGALVRDVMALLASVPRGLIICGPQDDPFLAEAVIAAARALSYPVLADPLSGVRCGRHDRTVVLDAYDAFLRDADFVAHTPPQVVLRFGAMPTSKPVLQYLQRYPQCRQIVIDGDGGWNEPTGLAAEVLHVDGRLLCEALAAAAPARLAGDPERAAWAQRWREANRAARVAIDRELAALDELFEGKVFAELADLLPDGAVLYAGNSMPVRDLDTFFRANERHIRFLGNRGVNGIDGVVSSALGAAAALQGAGPLVLVIGDLSFYHDSNGLLAAKQHGLDATIVLLNNDGGGIFSFLPQATEAAEHFELLFGTPHGLDFRPIAEAYGARFTRVRTWPEFREAVCAGIGGRGLHVVEVPTERRRNVALHRRIWPAVSAALRIACGV